MKIIVEPKGLVRIEVLSVVQLELIKLLYRYNYGHSHLEGDGKQASDKQYLVILSVVLYWRFEAALKSRSNFLSENIHTTFIRIKVADIYQWLTRRRRQKGGQTSRITETWELIGKRLFNDFKVADYESMLYFLWQFHFVQDLDMITRFLVLVVTLNVLILVPECFRNIVKPLIFPFIKFSHYINTP